MVSSITTSRRGFTLLELLIVLAILVVVVGLGWPSLRKMAERRELLDAARSLRGTLLRARLDAIEHGCVYQFRYRTGSGGYEVAPLDQRVAIPDEMLAAMPTDPDSAGGPSDWTSDTQRSANEMFLRGGIVFLDPAVPAEETRSEGISVEEPSEEWSDPILFFPNGRTFRAPLRLASRWFHVDIAVRGLSGSVAVGETQAFQTEDTSLPEAIPGSR